jgi:hypothetical protein
MRAQQTWLAASVLLCGCFDNVETMFPPGLEPWESPNEAPAPAAVEGDLHPEQIVFLRKRWTGGAYSVHARSYVKADVFTAFAAVRNPLAGADRRPAVTFTWEENVEPEYVYSHRSHLVIPDVVTVEFELTWHSGVVEGTEEAPTITATRWQKTWGTTAIPLLEGSIVCRRVTDDVTELEWQYHLNAFGSDWTTIEVYLSGYHDSIIALAHGLPLPPQE